MARPSGNGLDARLHRDEGISLVEMMVAILVVGLVLTAMAQVAIASLTSVQHTTGVTHATALGNEVIEGLLAIDYDLAGLTESDANATFGGTTFEGAELVILPDEMSGDPQVPVAVEVHTRDGLDYTAQTAVVWVDDPAGTTDTDYKRFVVDITWEVRGATDTRRVTALRAPTPADQPLSTRIDPDVVRLTVGGENVSVFTIDVIAAQPQQSVKIEWIDRSGVDKVLHLPSGGPLAWSFDFASGSYVLRNGETLYTITATAPDGVTETTTIGRVLFLHDIALGPGGIGVTPETLEVDDGTACTGLDLDIHVEGILASDSVTVSAGLVVGRPATAVGTTADGADFEVSFTAAEVATPNENLPVTVDVARGVGPEGTTNVLGPVTYDVPVTQLVDPETCSAVS